MRRIPPLNGLKAFESAARHRSITKAANELSVTQSAISKQVKLLEEYLSVKLFVRKNQLIVLTAEGERYFSSIQTAFQTIDHATHSILGQHGEAETLRLNVLPSLSNRWLIPMLKDFKKKHPDITVNIEVGDGPIEFNASAIDVAVRVSRPRQWKGMIAERLMDEDLIAVCSPRLNAVDVAAIDQHSLLQHTSRPDMWNDYLMSAGYANMNVNHELGFEHFFMLIDAAIDGLGIALVPRLLVSNELTRGSLIVALDFQYSSPFSYYFMCRNTEHPPRRVRLFREWLFSKI